MQQDAGKGRLILRALCGDGAGCGKSPNEERIRQRMGWQGLKPVSFC